MQERKIKTITKNTSPPKKTKLKLKAKYRRHLSFKLRLAFNLVVFLSSFTLCLYLAHESFELTDSKIINYKEKNDIDYQVHYKPNEFYETEYIDKNMIYVASLIDKIKIDFSYLFNIDENANLHFDYQVLGDLIISNLSGNTNYFEKQYVITDTKTSDLVSSKEEKINEEVEIDYNYYNQLANNFKTAYGIDTNSYLKVYLEVSKKSEGESENLNINDKTNSSIIIPLSERSIEIKFDSEDTILMNKAVTEKEVIFNKNVFIAEVILFLIASYFIFRVIRLISYLPKKRNDYDNYLNKILKEYDRLIVETTTGVDFKNNSIIKLEKFNELLDVRDNLKLPIMYYNVVKHQKCLFYIKNGSDIYLLKLKASDMNTGQKNQYSRI